MSSLPDILYDGGEIVNKELFQVTDYSRANWTASKAMDATGKMAELQAQAKEWHARIDAWLAAAIKEYENTTGFMKQLLEPFAKEELKDSKVRSIILPSARIGFRKSNSLEVSDEVAAVKWLKEHGKNDCVRIKEEVKKDETKALIKATGEIPDGCTPHSGDTFYIEPV
jgi:phage host-nuclease inhibitor protein Gam